MKHLNLFEAFDAEETVALVHTTTNTIARKIEAEGFVPTPFLDYKYYSELGKEGIYFYDGSVVDIARGLAAPQAILEGER